MTTDFRGVPVSATNESALDAADDFNRRLVRMDAGAGRILDALAAEPADPLLALYGAVVNLYAQQTAPNDRAQALLAQVAAAPDMLSDRDARLLAALQALAAGRNHEAIRLLEDLTEVFPGDLLAAKICEFAYYLLGQQNCGPVYRAHMRRLAPLHGDDPDYLGMAAFAHELCDEFGRAEELALRAIEIEPRNPWAEHALSHAYIRQGRVAEGRDRMRTFLPSLRTCDPLIYCHDVWHLALLEIDLGDAAAAGAILRDDVWGPYPGTSAQQVDGISLGWRLEMVGEDLGDFWSAVAEHVASETGQVFIPFVAAHHAYALARAGRGEDVRRLLATARTRAARDDVEARDIWAPVGLPVVEAAAAHGAGDLATAVNRLTPAAADIAPVGGSDAQTDLFRMSYAYCLARTGRAPDAERYWRRATATRPPNELDARLLTP